MKGLIIALALFVVVSGAPYKGVVHISYTVWSEKIYESLNTTIDTNVYDVTFFDVMALQAWLDPERFGFTSEEVEGYGKVITSIQGLANNATEKVAWQLYILPEYPNIEDGIPDDSYKAEKSVENILIEDKQNFLFIYLDTRPGNN